MGEQELPPDYHIQHDDPPIFYCWKYWMRTGEYHQGCTDVIGSPENFLDLNDYGWVYIVIPIAALFLFIFLFYCCCRGGGHQKTPKPAILSEDSDSDDSEVFRTRGKSSYRAVPVRNSDAKNYYTVVPIDPNNPQKMPLQGGIDASYPGYMPQQRLYPRLTAMRQQAGINGAATGKGVGGQPKSVQEGKTNEYHPDPASMREMQPKQPDNKMNERQDSSSSDESEDEK